jgi:hypothetical protein
MLAAKGNPNVLSLLWTPPLYATVEGQALIAHRKLFVSKRAYHAFGGYAHGQLQRMTNWKNEQEAGCGCQGDFHEGECAMNLARGRGSQKRYATGFMGAKRKAAVEKLGYDSKNAAHLIRLLNMGIEFLQTGELQVDRTGNDAEMLMMIKRGQYALESLQDMAEELFEVLKTSLLKSPLPEDPDYVGINKLLYELNCRRFATEMVLVVHKLNKEGLVR